MKPISTVLTAFLALNLLLCANTAIANVQDAKFYERVAEQYILAQFPPSDGSYKVEVNASKVDTDRDFGGRCEGYLTAELHGQSIKSTSTVKIICSRPSNPFTIFIPVKVERLVASIVAARNLSKGEIIAKNDLKAVFAPNNTTTKASISNPELLIGSRIKQNIKQGDMIKPQNFCVVCKGDSITLEAQSSGLSLKTTATALEDGFFNDTIRVKNNQSKKVLNAKVFAPGQARVVM